jgi:hypothetical protein
MCSKVDVRGADDSRVALLGCNVDFPRQAAACLSLHSFVLETCSEAEVQGANDADDSRIARVATSTSSAFHVHSYSETDHPQAFSQKSLS